MRTSQLQSVVWKEDKYFVAQCLNVDVSSFGETREEAISNLDEALALYFDDEGVGEMQEVINPEIVPISLTYA